MQKATGIAGAERHLSTLLPGLKERGVEVRMVLLGDGDFRRYSDLLECAGVETAVVPAGHDVNPSLVRRIAKEAVAWNADLIHTHLIHADIHGQLAARLSGTRSVSSVHGTHPFYQRQPYRLAARVAETISTRTIAISQHVARFLLTERLAAASKIRIVPYGIDAREWVISEAERSSARRNLGFNDNTIVVGVASRLVQNKGHDILIRACALARHQCRDLHLLVAGDGPLRGELESQARSQLDNGATFLGFVPHIRNLMAASDLVAFPTQPGFGEGFGLAALEASAAAIPLVATNIDSLPEIVEDGESGLLVAPSDLGALADAIGRLGRDRGLRRQLGAVGRQRAQERFAVTEMIARTIGVYNEAVSGGFTADGISGGLTSDRSGLLER